jgi:hypothetical protein
LPTSKLRRERTFRKNRLKTEGEHCTLPDAPGGRDASPKEDEAFS